MLCADAGILDRVEIIGSDISRRVLRRAEAGSYPRRALRRPPPFELERYLTVDDEKIAVVPAIRRAVEWRRLNLVDRAGFATLGTFDAVLCRNALIYFDDVRATEVVASLAASLAPGGAFLVGVSESLLRFATSLVCEEHEGNFLYRKPQ
jgi:chemotaxis protein methyltransferase CheR